jgi:hypothetical protein
VVRLVVVSGSAESFERPLARGKLAEVPRLKLGMHQGMLLQVRLQLEVPAAVQTFMLADVNLNANL